MADKDKERALRQARFSAAVGRILSSPEAQAELEKLGPSFANVGKLMGMLSNAELVEMIENDTHTPDAASHEGMEFLNSLDINEVDKIGSTLVNFKFLFEHSAENVAEYMSTMRTAEAIDMAAKKLKKMLAKQRLQEQQEQPGNGSPFIPVDPKLPVS